MPPSPQPAAADAVTGLLLPLWQIIIGGLVVVAVAVSAVRLARRGPSRITTSMVVTAAAVFGIAALGYLLRSL